LDFVLVKEIKVAQNAKYLLAVTGDAVLVEHLPARSGPDIESGTDQLCDVIISVVVPDGICVIPGLIDPAGQADVSAVGIYTALVLVLYIVLTVDVESGPVDNVQVFIDIVLQGSLPEDTVGFLGGFGIKNRPDRMLYGVILAIVYTSPGYWILVRQALDIHGSWGKPKIAEYR